MASKNIDDHPPARVGAEFVLVLGFRCQLWVLHLYHDDLVLWVLLQHAFQCVKLGHSSPAALMDKINRTVLEVHEVMGYDQLTVVRDDDVQLNAVRVVNSLHEAIDCVLERVGIVGEHAILPAAAVPDCYRRAAVCRQLGRHETVP